MSLTLVRKAVPKVHRGKPVQSRANALWNSPLVDWDPLE